MKLFNALQKAVVFLFLLTLISCSAKQKSPFSTKMPGWMRDQIKEDLSAFPENNFSLQNLDNLMQEKAEACLLVRYTISNGVVHYATPVQDEGILFRAQAIQTALQKLCKKIEMPNVDFIATMHDSLDGEDLDVPVLAFAKMSTSKIVLMPDFEALLGYPGMRDQVKKANKEFPWNKKINQVAWRGATTGGIFSSDNFLDFPRTKACSASLQWPNLVNAKFSTLVQCVDPDKVQEMYPEYFGSSLSISQQIQYKYQLLIDGNSCAYSRAYWQFFSNCAVIKQASPSIQWYYRLLTPYVNFIPVNEDLSNLEDVLNWCLTHDSEVKKISNTAQKFAKKNLVHSSILQYTYFLLQEYAKIQSSSL